MVKTDSIKNSVLEKKLEEIAKDTFNEILALNKFSRPKKVFLYNANQSYLIKVLLNIQFKIKDYEAKNKTRLNLEIYTDYPNKKSYGVNVGHYL
jgi:hypothetical protein